MSAARRGWRRVNAAAITVASVGVLLLGTLAPATAAPLSVGQLETLGSQAIAKDIELHNHSKGSQIARVEGEASVSRSSAAALRSQGTIGTDNVQIHATMAGLDVASYQGNVDWAYWWGQGKRFVWTKATESTSYTNPYFAQQYNGSYEAGFIRGAYHFATPDTSSGAAQANYFVDHGGSWPRDGRTLPGALDMEYNPYGRTCYGLSQASMAAWIRSFHNQYHLRTGRYPVIYTSTRWWNKCVGKAQTFGSTAPLWVARYAASVGTLPIGWSYYSVWQYTSSPLDQNTFNGPSDQLRTLANG
jgi:GH25 family lysozyme M1 (1,4-beta-N-acetylmuramidase)